MKRSGRRSSIVPLIVLGSAIPAFAGITYTCDPNIEAAHAGTCAYLNSTIAGLYNTTFSNANASIYVQYGNTELGESDTSLIQVGYSAYLKALTANSRASANAVQVSAVEALNSFDTALYGGGSVEIPTALASALGFTRLSGLLADGMTFCNTPGAATCYNGIDHGSDEQFVLPERDRGLAPIRLLLHRGTRDRRSSGDGFLYRHHGAVSG